MCAQKPSPQKKFGDPANLVNEFVHFAGTILLIPHGAIFRFPVWIDPQRDCGNRKGRGVWVCGAHKLRTSNPVSNRRSRAVPLVPTENTFIDKHLRARTSLRAGRCHGPSEVGAHIFTCTSPPANLRYGASVVACANVCPFCSRIAFASSGEHQLGRTAPPKIISFDMELL
jgi:hypothetical protein